MASQSFEARNLKITFEKVNKNSKLIKFYGGKKVILLKLFTTRPIKSIFSTSSREFSKTLLQRSVTIGVTQRRGLSYIKGQTFFLFLFYSKEISLWESKRGRRKGRLLLILQDLLKAFVKTILISLF